MRIVSWNINRGYQPDAIARQLADLEADVYLLTELDIGVDRTGGIDMVRHLEEALGLEGFFAREFIELPSIWRRIIPQGGPGGGIHGNAIFSRFELQDYRVVELPTADPLHWQRSTWIPELFEPRIGQRVAQQAEIEWDGRRLSLVNTHLENWRSSPGHRRQQLETALEGVRAGELILGGDFNVIDGITSSFLRSRPVTHEVAAMRRFLAQRGLGDPFEDTDYTFREFGLKAKLDWLVVSSGLRVKDKGLIHNGVSDHGLLWLDVQ